MISAKRGLDALHKLLIQLVSFVFLTDKYGSITSDPPMVQIKAELGGPSRDYPVDVTIAFSLRKIS